MIFTRLALFLAMVSAVSAGSPVFVPACIAEQCSAEAVALGGGGYTRALATCTVQNFGPCAPKAWECLGDAPCRKAMTCAPRVLDTCKADIWKMVTDPNEREKIMCIESCLKDGKVNPLCVVVKCGKAAAECLTDETCRSVVECVPKAQLACSKGAFDCVFGEDAVCRENLQCLGTGIARCGGSAVNMLTDTKIADFVSCAGSKCPHPATRADAIAQVPMLAPVPLRSGPPSSAMEQLLCIAEKCGSRVLSIFTDQDTRDLLQCALKADLMDLCSSVWGCLSDPRCAKALSCWAKPFDSCKGDIWKVLTVDAERRRIEEGAGCLRGCEQEHQGDFVGATFCVLDRCSEGLLDCYRDDTCRDALKCLPSTVGQCAVPQLEAYVQQELFRNSTKCLGRGLESCGRAAVEMLRDQDIAVAVRCAAQCTRPPPQSRAIVV